VGGLAGKQVLVVGASSGVGRHFARTARLRGADVAVAARSRAGLEETTAGVGGVVIVGDVTSSDDCRRIVDEAVDALGPLDAIFYTPAPGYQMLLRDTRRDDWIAQFDSMVVGACNVTQAALAHLRPAAVLCYLSSVITSAPQFGMASYAACKAALETMVQGWQIEQPDFRFCVIPIGATAGGSDRSQHQQDPALGREIMRQFVGRGFLQTRIMEAPDLGEYLADTVANLLAHPGITTNEGRITPAAPTLFADEFARRFGAGEEE
jgi:NAD(P)-dependent dehydrogenase (short-subunit alcohol dehydrogenase family)